MPLLHFRIAELNALINKDASHSIKPLNTPRPQTPKKLHLSLYADGITVNKGPLRPFTDSATHAFLQDINDGYFPYELRHLYPEGVPFVLHDEITRQYADACASFVPFTGTGRLLKADVEELLIGTQQSRTEQSESINLDSVRKARLSLHGETNINVKSSNSIDMKSQQTILVPNESNPDGFTTTASMPTITPTNHVFIRVHSIHGHSLLCLVPQGWTQRDFLDALRPRVAKPFRILARQGNGRWEEVRESESTMALFQGWTWSISWTRNEKQTKCNRPPTKQK
ncbi:SEP domain-containing protein [Chytriomyces sp. MP71]|nr:SEP domain-containing protein [Chytriomyces sp. MP71]